MLRTPQAIRDSHLTEFCTWLREGATSKIEQIEAHLEQQVSLNFESGAARSESIVTLIWEGRQTIEAKAKELHLSSEAQLGVHIEACLNEVLTVIIPTREHYDQARANRKSDSPLDIEIYLTWTVPQSQS